MEPFCNQMLWTSTFVYGSRNVFFNCQKLNGHVTDWHCNLETELGQRADLVKIKKKNIIVWLIQCKYILFWRIEISKAQYVYIYIYIFYFIDWKLGICNMVGLWRPWIGENYYEYTWNKDCTALHQEGWLLIYSLLTMSWPSFSVFSSQKIIWFSYET